MPPYVREYCSLQTKEDLLHACLKYIKIAKGFQLPIDSLFLLLSVIRCYSRTYECVRRMILSLDYPWVLNQIRTATHAIDISIGAKPGFLILDLDPPKLQALWKDYGEFRGNLISYNERMETLLHRKPVVY